MYSDYSLWQDLQATKAAAHTRANEHGKYARVYLVSRWRIALFRTSIVDDNNTVAAETCRRRYRKYLNGQPTFLSASVDGTSMLIVLYTDFRVPTVIDIINVKYIRLAGCGRRGAAGR
jgi:hypothetical protein